MPPAKIVTKDPDCPADRPNGLRDGAGKLISCHVDHAEAHRAMAEAGLASRVPMMDDSEEAGGTDAEIADGAGR